MLNSLDVIYIPQKGDTVSFCGVIGTVIKNMGNKGIVKGKNGTLIEWYWSFMGETVKQIK